MLTSDLKKSLVTVISTLGYDVYEYSRVPKSAQFPYVTYTLNGSGESDRDDISSVVFTLDLDLFDYVKTKNTATLDGMVNAVDNLMNRKDVIASAFFYRTEREVILLTMPTADEYTFRRRLVYNLKYSEKEI